jgi:CRISPR-associated endonuclease Cas1
VFIGVRMSASGDRTLPTTLEEIKPKFGVVTLSGYGISARVERGHLVLEDGIGLERREARYPRVGHGLKRLVVIGSDGNVSLAALRWLADQNAAFVMLERNGSVLTTTGPVRSSDARLRRAQAVAHYSGIALRIAKELISQKLIGQEQVVRKHFGNHGAGDAIAIARNTLTKAASSDEVRVWESQGALAYWTAWHDLQITFPRADAHRVPEHWQRFGARISPLTKSPRLAVNPPNAMLNYLYALLESEARLALVTLGLDPGLGILHNDLNSRDSLACDLLEPIRPKVDFFLLQRLKSGPLRREWFLELRDGNCRLINSLAAQLSETVHIWRHALAPFAEGIARALWTMTPKKEKIHGPATRLTQSRKREVKGIGLNTPVKSRQTIDSVCRICGNGIKTGFQYCVGCVPTISKINILSASKLGRLATHSPLAQARRAATQRRQNAALNSWKPESKPDWLDEAAYIKRIQPLLKKIKVPTVQNLLSVSEPYALRIRSGHCVPHPRHWVRLGILVGKS